MSTARNIGHGSYSYGADGSERYVTWGNVRGFGPVRQERRLAEEDLKADSAGCRDQGGYSDRAVYEIDSEGYLRTIGNRMLVWPSSGRGNGAVRVEG